jgi:hypothetical protein
VQQFVRRIIANFGITSKWRNAVSYAVTRFEVVYASANTLHGTNAFKADNDWARWDYPRMRNSTTMVCIGKVYTYCGVP